LLQSSYSQDLPTLNSEEPKVFRIVAKYGDIEYWATDILEMDEAKREKMGGYSWKIEEYHRGIKQFCGVECCHARKSQSQRAHILFSLRAFLRFEAERLGKGMSWFESKRSIFRGAICEYIKYPIYSLSKAPTAYVLPYIQLHEFERLLFIDVKIMDDILKPCHDYSKLQELKNIRNLFHTPEEIDDGFGTAPSKRIIKLFKSYQKVTNGYQIAERIGIDVIRKECPHFNEWMVKLGRLVIYGQSRS